MHVVHDGTIYKARKDDRDAYCILGSCVGVVIETTDEVMITHGKLPDEVHNQIQYAIKDHIAYQASHVTLLGGNNTHGSIGQRNIDAAHQALSTVAGVHVDDRTGHVASITVRDGNVKIKTQDE